MLDLYLLCNWCHCDLLYSFLDCSLLFILTHHFVYLLPCSPLALGFLATALASIPLCESTAIYIENILTKLTTIGALYLTLVCLMPEFLIANYPIPFYLGGTSVLIVVVVAIDTVTQIQTRLMSSQYEQLIKKTKFGNR